MVELSTAPDEARQRIEQLGTVDLVVGIVDEKALPNVESVVTAIREGLARVPGAASTAVVLRRESASALVKENLEALESDTLRLATYSLPGVDPSITAIQTIANAYRAIWNAALRLNARACVVIVSSVETLTADWITGLAYPILEESFDLVAPCYAMHKFEGLLNNAVLYPLTRSLYGKRVENPLGPDFGVSARFLETVLQVDSTRSRTAGPQQFALLAPLAAARGFKACQTYLGRRIYPAVDWKNVDSILAEILGPVFLSVEQDAPFWQHIRTSEPVPTYGDVLTIVDENIAVDTRRLLDPFRLGFRNLQEIWSLVLPPTALFELKRADRLPPERFRIPDELWARIVYDFALAHRLRTIARDHLLRAMTPLYLGWLASYALEIESGGISVHGRLEALCTAYEQAKPYFVSRWRWPDRFNP